MNRAVTDGIAPLNRWPTPQDMLGLITRPATLLPDDSAWARAFATASVMWLGEHRIVPGGGGASNIATAATSFWSFAGQLSSTRVYLHADTRPYFLGGLFAEPISSTELKGGFKVSSGIAQWYRSSYGIDFEKSEIASPEPRQLHTVGRLDPSAPPSTIWRSFATSLGSTATWVPARWATWCLGHRGAQGPQGPGSRPPEGSSARLPRGFVR